MEEFCSEVQSLDGRRAPPTCLVQQAAWRHEIAARTSVPVHNLPAECEPAPLAAHKGVVAVLGEGEEVVGPLYGTHLSRLPVHWDTALPEKPHVTVQMGEMGAADGVPGAASALCQSSEARAPPLLSLWKDDPASGGAWGPSYSRASW